MKFEKLTPNENVNISSYEEALNFAFSNDDITNIAISGSYGVGKSSIIETFKKKHPENKYLHISLSHFTDANKLDTNILEGKIVNQLLHQIEYKRIPQTIFKIKENPSKKKIIKLTLLICLFLATMFITFRFGNWNDFIINNFPKNNTNSLLYNILGGFSNNWILFCSGLIFIFLSLYFIYRLIALQFNRQLLKKITVKGNEVEIFKDRDESYFDKFMNDVIYLFVNSGKDVIVFEDLDRFNDATIYERLHEINTLVNRRLKVIQKENTKNEFLKNVPLLKKNREHELCKRITFIYLIKDDTFQSKDRTKFFDLVIPVVPVVDSSNSFDKFLEVFKKSAIDKDFDNQILKKLSLYIDDMRLLKNINNEYLIYKNRLCDISLNNNKLLSIVIYKNLFPKDFSLFQLGRGYINNVFRYKDELIQERVENISSNLEELENSILSIENEEILNLNELDALYLKFPPEYIGFSVSNEQENDFFNRGKWINTIKQNEFKVEAKRIGYSGSYELDLRSSFDELSEIEEYQRRKKIIEQKYSFKKKHLVQKKVKLEFEKRRVASLSIEVLLKEQENDFFSKESTEFDYLIKSPYFLLIPFLLRNGLIDENYNDYLTYFYENSLKKSDKEFLRGIYDKADKNIDYSLVNPSLVLSNLSAEDILANTVKNVDLAEFLIQNHQQYEMHVVNILEIMKNNNTGEYLLLTFNKFRLNKNLSQFTNVIIKYWTSVLYDIVYMNDIDKINKIDLIYGMSQFCSKDFLEHNNSNDDLALFIGEYGVPNSFNQPMLKDQLFEVLTKFSHLKIKYISLENTELSTLKKILELRIYEISYQNINTILKEYQIDFSENEFNHSNISLVYRSNIEDLYKYLIEEKINTYIRVYLDFGDTELHEKRRDILDILDRENLDIDLSKSLLRRVYLDEKINDIGEVTNKEFWSLLFANENIEINGVNVVKLFVDNENNLSDELISAINHTEAQVELPNDIEKELKNNLFDKIVLAKGIDKKQYISMLKSLNLIYTKGYPLELSVEAVKNLIASKIIKLTKENLKNTQKNHSIALCEYFLKDEDKFLKIYQEEDVYNQDDLILLIENREFDFSQLKKLVDISIDQISIQNLKVTDGLYKYILINKFDENDLEYIANKFSSFNRTLRYTIKDIAIERIEKLCESNLDIDIELLKEILDDDVDVDKRLLFASYINKFSKIDVLNYIQKLNFPTEFTSVLRKGRPRFEDTEINRLILDDYKRRNWVTKINDENGQLRVQGRKIII